MDRVQSVSHKRTDEEVYTNRLDGECYILTWSSSALFFTPRLVAREFDPLLTILKARMHANEIKL